MGKRGFIFDLDGVIVDTAKYHYLAWKKLADRLGIVFTEEHNELFKGVSRRRCLEILLEMGNLKVQNEQFEAMLVEKNQDYLQSIAHMDASEILPGVSLVLEFLRKSQMPMALGSASKNAVPILEMVGLRHYFDVVVDGNHVSRAKPDPEVFLLAADGIGMRAGDCVVFEDAVAGIRAANAGGMVSVGIGNANVLSEAKYIFNDFTEISTEFIKQLVTD
ncbi:MAG: beta-phosphoglucomutase [Sediminicola sp.]